MTITQCVFCENSAWYFDGAIRERTGRGMLGRMAARAARLRPATNRPPSCLCRCGTAAPATAHAATTASAPAHAPQELWPRRGLGTAPSIPSPPSALLPITTSDGWHRTQQSCRIAGHASRFNRAVWPTELAFCRRSTAALSTVPPLPARGRGGS